MRYPSVQVSLTVLALTVWLAGCAGKPPPDWQMNARGAIERSTLAWLEGNTRIGEAEYRRAQAEISRTGNLELTLRLALMRCAARVASLDPPDCPEAQVLARDGTPADRAYGRYLRGQASTDDAPLLPPAHRALTAAGTAEAAALALGQIPDPQSRLIAAGVLLLQGRADGQIVQQALDTASAQGWRRPLLAWLLVARDGARAAGAVEETDRLQRRIDLVGGRVNP